MSTAESVARMIEGGNLCYASIGEAVGVSRERVRQLSNKMGLHEAVKLSKKARREAKVKPAGRNRSGGLDVATWRRLVDVGATKAYAQQRRNAAQRGIQWELSISDWWKIWDESGKWEQRGRRQGQYCMTRHGDDGPYELGNVAIKTNKENFLFAKSHGARGRGGVYLTHPGTIKPWIAKARGRYLGYFATAEEAVAAREAALRAWSCAAAQEV